MANSDLLESEEGVVWAALPDADSLPARFLQQMRVQRLLLCDALRDRWLMGALAVLSERPQLLGDLVGWQAGARAGVVEARVVLGVAPNEKCVTVDSMLPQSAEEGRKALHAEVVGSNVAWMSLVEKAYAKRFGGYRKLAGGSLQSAMIDLSKCVVTVEVFDSPRVAPQVGSGALLRRIQRECGSALLCLLAHTRLASDGGQDDGYGVLSLSPYAVLATREEGGVVYLKLRCVWSVRWCGDTPSFSDASDNSFWIASDDCFIHFNRLLTVCCQPTMHSVRFNSEFGVACAGGSYTAGGDFGSNPQYAVKVEQAQDVFVRLSQPSCREVGLRKDYDVALGFYIFRRVANGLRCKQFLQSELVYKSGFLEARDLCRRVSLEAGEYYLIPATLLARQYVAYGLEVRGLEGTFSVQEVVERDLESATDIGNWQNSCLGSLSVWNWWKQPQWKLTPHESCYVRITVSCRGLPAAWGFHVFESERRVEFANQYIASSFFDDADTKSLQLRAERNRSYILLPCTQRPTQVATLTDFRITVTSSHACDLKRCARPPAHDTLRSCSWDAATPYRWAGGTHEMADWLRNLRLPLVVRESGSFLFVLATEVDAPIAIYLVRDTHNDKTISTELIAAFSEYTTDSHVALRVPSLPEGRYVLVPTVMKPGHSGRFDMLCISEQPFQLGEPWSGPQESAADED